MTLSSGSQPPLLSAKQGCVVVELLLELGPRLLHDLVPRLLLERLLELLQELVPRLLPRLMLELLLELLPKLLLKCPSLHQIDRPCACRCRASHRHRRAPRWSQPFAMLKQNHLSFCLEKKQMVPFFHGIPVCVVGCVQICTHQNARTHIPHSKAQGARRQRRGCHGARGAGGASGRRATKAVLPEADQPRPREQCRRNGSHGACRRDGTTRPVAGAQCPCRECSGCLSEWLSRRKSEQCSRQGAVQDEHCVLHRCVCVCAGACVCMCVSTVPWRGVRRRCELHQ